MLEPREGRQPLRARAQGRTVDPFGSSGTRYVLTLATELHLTGARYGVLGVCVGSGQGVAMVLENPDATR